MTKPPRNSPLSGSRDELGRTHRIRVLQVLLGICHNLEELQTTPSAKTACRAVATRLRGVLAEQEVGVSPR